MATTTAPTEIEALQGAFIEVAEPAMYRLAEIAETIRGELNSRFTNPESAAKQMSSVEGIPNLVNERSRLLADIGSADARARMALDRWLEDQRAAHRRAQATDPEFDSPEGQQRKLLQMAQADDLSALPADELLADANRMLVLGDVAGATIRLKAARLAGSNRPGKLRDVQDAIDKVLDRTVPHRIAATEQLKAALATYRDVLTLVLKTQLLTGNLSKAAPTNPEPELTNLLAWADEVAR